MEQSPRLSLSYLAPSQAQKHVTVNETFRRLDQLCQQTVLSRTTDAEPGSPGDGDAYILTGSASGTDWDNFSEHNIAAWQDGAWIEIVPKEGWRAWVADDDEFVVHDGASWAELSHTGAHDLDGEDLTLDADADSYLHAPADDEIEIVLGGAAVLGMVSTGALTLEGANVADNLAVFKATSTGTDLNATFINDNSASTSNVVRFKFQLKTDSQTRSAGAIQGRFTDIADSTRAGVFEFLTSNPSFLTRMAIGLGLYVGSPTGGDKGSGTVNAEAVYDDNTLLTCYVFDQALDGAIDVAKWDAKVPDRMRPAEIDENTGEIVKPAETIVRNHEPLRKFAARIGTGHDPLTLDGYATHWKEKRHLTALPNEAAFDPVNGQLTTGEWVQRLVETVEIQAVLIETLNSRVKALEAAAGGGR